MKCIKNLKTGEIVRVADKQAHQTVGSQWSYVAKSEWKKATRKEVVVEEKKEEEVIKEKPKFKKGQKQTK
jgi:hypothetical protein